MNLSAYGSTLFIPPNAPTSGWVPASKPFSGRPGGDALQEKIDFFFLPPNQTTPETGEFSVLYLLRRDVISCFEADPSTNRPRAVFPGLMGILAGVDLLGKFVVGGEVGKQKDWFDAYWKECFPGATQQAHLDVLYYLRNALVHYFGLSASSKSGNTVYGFELAPHQTVLIDKRGDTYQVNPQILFDQWEASAGDYQSKLGTDRDLRTNFETMFSKYGRMKISPAPPTP